MGLKLSEPEVIEANEVQVLQTLIETPVDKNLPIRITVVFVKGYRDEKGNFIAVRGPQRVTFSEWILSPSGERIFDDAMKKVISKFYEPVKKELVYFLLKSKGILKGDIE